MNFTIVLALALALALAGSSCIYLASPHQRWLTRAWQPVPARVLGAGLLAGSLAAFLQDMQLAAATFTFVTILMLLFILLPYLGALIVLNQER